MKSQCSHVEQSDSADEKGKWVLVAQWSPALCDPMDCNLPGSSVHGILQTRILEWVAISFSINLYNAVCQLCLSKIGRRNQYLWIYLQITTINVSFSFFPNVPLVSKISHRVASILLKNSIKSLVKYIGYQNISINPYTIAKLKMFIFF